MHAVFWASVGTLFPFLMTALGAAVVFLFAGKSSARFQKMSLGFAAGVMIAASVWSLLLPAIAQAEEQGSPGWLVAGGGFLLGVVFLLLLDTLMPHLHAQASSPEGIHTHLGKNTLLFLAVTLHNIPEGMAVGLAFALGAQQGSDYTAFASALALCIGMGVQNFPEGAAISLPLKQEGMSAKKAFGFGALSGVVEPVFGILTVLVAGTVSTAMPWLLSFAAGAMMYVVVEELIPQAHLGEHSNAGTISVMAGFVLMMILDIAMG